jgi:hypothetical protein
VDNLGQRDQLVLRIRPLGEVGDRALLHLLWGGRVDRSNAGKRPVIAVVRGVQARHVDACDPGEGHVDILAGGPPLRLPCGHHRTDLRHHLLAVPQDGGVDEVDQRLRVVGAVAAHQHERVLRATVGGQDRDPGEVEALEQVRVDEFGRQVEGQHVEVARRTVRVEREQGQALTAQHSGEVGPRRVGPLSHRIWPFV